MTFPYLPFLLFFIVPILFIVWFSSTIIKLQKETNKLLGLIAEKISNIEK